MPARPQRRVFRSSPRTALIVACKRSATLPATPVAQMGVCPATVKTPGTNPTSAGHGMSDGCVASATPTASSTFPARLQIQLRRMVLIPAFRSGPGVQGQDQVQAQHAQQTDAAGQAFHQSPGTEGVPEVQVEIFL